MKFLFFLFGLHSFVPMETVIVITIDILANLLRMESNGNAYPIK